MCVCAIVSALSALALLAPLAKWGVLMLFRPSAREEMPKHAKRALGPYLWPTAFLNMCAVPGEGLTSAFVRGGWLTLCMQQEFLYLLTPALEPMSYPGLHKSL